MQWNSTGSCKFFVVMKVHFIFMQYALQLILLPSKLYIVTWLSAILPLADDAQLKVYESILFFYTLCLVFLILTIQSSVIQYFQSLRGSGGKRDPVAHAGRTMLLRVSHPGLTDKHTDRQTDERTNGSQTWSQYKWFDMAQKSHRLAVIRPVTCSPLTCMRLSTIRRGLIRAIRGVN